MNWGDLFTALALVLIIEGLMPFANPGGMRRTMAMLAQMDDSRLRRFGLISIIIGLVLLYFIRT
ncbi:MAG: DUF2065 domain-containing protein [Gammaproteobacteria bacterium]|jgi:hypothetical protein